MRPNLVINVGVRYEYYSVFRDKEGLLLNEGNLGNAFAIPARYRPADSFYNADRNNVLPRVGFAWSPGKGGKTAIHGGFGVTVAPMDLRNFYTLVAYDPQVHFSLSFHGRRHYAPESPVSDHQPGSAAVHTQPGRAAQLRDL